MSDNSHGLPAPDPDAAAVSERLVARIREEIATAGGSLGFDRFMEMALYQPGFGYYSAGSAKFGAGGDFVTAPQVSSLFSRTLAVQCEQCLRGLEGGDILEFGAGSGRMALDLLLELERRDALPDRYLILEVSASLRARQYELFEAEASRLLNSVHWLDRLPGDFSGVMLANEVLDALPVKRFRKADGEVRELRVTVDESGNLAWLEAAPDPGLLNAIAGIEQECGPLADGYTSEVNLSATPWLGSLADSLARGVILLIDYGYPRREYYHPQRDMGTLICHYRHRAHDDPLTLVGLQDITAFVDFTAVAQAAVDADLDVLGFAPQAQFLLGAGLPGLVAASAEDPVEQMQLAQQVKALTLPGEMGERFKILGVGRGVDAPLDGFSLVDHRGRL